MPSRALLLLAVAVSLTACSAPDQGSSPGPGTSSRSVTAPPPVSTSERPVERTRPSASPRGTAPPRSVASASDTAAPRSPAASDGRPRRASMSIPALGTEGLVVVPYVGRTDDAAGTRIQDRGLAASPHGPAGGVGPGGIGNFQVTAHRTSSTAAFARLPSLDAGDRVEVRSGGSLFVYEIRRTRRTSFRIPTSLARQRAAVPGQPGVEPTRAYLTLSTCATPEDHAAGNFWSDELHNPEHRIDKIGVLVATRPG